MKICFVQPNTDYQIRKNRHALALTFPQIISDIEVDEDCYCIYIAGKMNNNFRDYLVYNQVTHVFITAITSTFPYAIELAKEAQEEKCVVVLGGLFATMNSTTIKNHYPCFDYIVAGYSDDSILKNVMKKPLTPKVVTTFKRSDYLKPLGQIITGEAFRNIYDINDTICYELANGCDHNCDFCSMRRAFPEKQICRRRVDTAIEDIRMLSNYWEKLKLIDDDILLSADTLKHLDFHDFNEVIAETRLDRISEETVKILSNAGITHLIVGVESFDVEFLNLSKKTQYSQNWEGHLIYALNLLSKYSIIMRPVMMITNPTTTIWKMEELMNSLRRYFHAPNPYVEFLCSFYTPHPGMIKSDEVKGFLTHNLVYFDHLHLVWLPSMLNRDSIGNIRSIYQEIVKITQSEEYNPPLSFSFIEETTYEPFFVEKGKLQ